MSAYTRYVAWQEWHGVVDRETREPVADLLALRGTSKKLRRMMGKALVQEWNNQVRGQRLAKGLGA